MIELESLLLDVWREACRHIEIAESTARIGRLLAARLSVDRLVVSRVDADRGTIETVGGGGPSPDQMAPSDPRRPSAGQMRRLVAWLRRGEIAEVVAAHNPPPPLAVALSPDPAANRLVGPLVSEHGTLGLLVIEARPPHRIAADHRRIFKRLLEPFTVALDNDQRLHELTALREAAEADKRSLLTRLGREDLSEAIVGADGGLAPVLERVGLVARSDVPVLILGETGSGKEVIARAIHNRSPRRVGPFIRVNCGAIPPELIDSELFGHEKGAFTGATETRRGWFERADEGTLFLDEIGDLPQAAQVRLLRVVQEGSLERVGGGKPLHVDVRIVAATHRDLAAMVRNRTFREDLWYRLAVFPIILPPLREHKEDIAALAEHFARRAAHRFGLTPQTPTAGDLALLTRYNWPGNIRELASVVDRAAILGDGERLEIARALGLPQATIPASVVASAPPAAQSPSTVIRLDEAMKRHIELALSATRGKIEGPGGVAELLHINPHTLRARMRKLGIRWAQYRTYDLGPTSIDGS